MDVVEFSTKYVIFVLFDEISVVEEDCLNPSHVKTKIK